MALTPSKMLPLGTIAPAFTLIDTITQQKMSLQELKSPLATVIMFICNHCPYVQHIQPVIVSLAKTYQARNISFIAISANDILHYPADAPAEMRITAVQAGFTFPYLFDATQAIAKAYQAACTPDFFVFDAALACVYRGQFDAARPGNAIPVTGASLRAALDNLLAGEELDHDQKPSVGCNIKWLRPEA